MALIPTVKWAQREAVVYLTIDVQDSKEPKLEVTNSEDGKNGHLTYRATASGGVEDQEYALDLMLYGGVDKEKSRITISPRSVFLVLEKSEAGTWPRLTKDTGRHLSHIKVDWDKWVDSDDEGDDAFDPSAMGDFSSLGGMGGGLGGMMGGGMGGLAGMMGGGMGGLDGIDFSALGGGGGGDGEPGGAGDAAGADSDDEDLPELQA
ncbi:P23-1 [Scenedesmus sp. PABB004]|nr:P23-1 [Scenedesmus sp. PABB004]